MPNSPDWRCLYPFASHFLQLGEVRCHYLDEGAGDVLLMVHGNPTWSFYWRNLITGLRDQYRIVVPDHVGCGLSDKPLDYRYSLQRHTANLVQLVDRLQLDDITLVGHDWGGAIGSGARFSVRSGSPAWCCSTPAPFLRRASRGALPSAGRRCWAPGLCKAQTYSPAQPYAWRSPSRSA